MDWNRAIMIGAQCVVLCVLGALVATGHNSMITDGLMVVAGSICGTGLYGAIAKKKVAE